MLIGTLAGLALVVSIPKELPILFREDYTLACNKPAWVVRYWEELVPDAPPQQVEIFAVVEYNTGSEQFEVWPIFNTAYRIHCSTFQKEDNHRGTL